MSDGAFGAPGSPPTWSNGTKDGVGTAYSAATRLWYTLWKGIVTEVYFPTIDRPQIKDLQLLFVNGASIEDEMSINTDTSQIDESLGYRIEGRGKDFSYVKEVIADPHLPCLLMHTRIKAAPIVLKSLNVYALCAPRMGGAGADNVAEVIDYLGRKVLLAHGDGVCLAMASPHPFARASVGFAGQSDGLTDLRKNGAMTWEFRQAENGHVVLTGELSCRDTQEFTLAMAFGETPHRVLTTLMQSLAIPFAVHRQRFIDQWARVYKRAAPLESQSGDGGALYRSSLRLLLAHEDKVNPGAQIASLAIPWGDVRSHEDGNGGYHLVWTRDLVQCAMGQLAAGNTETPMRTLIYLAASQNADGSFPQNFWVDGGAFWKKLQLDQVAFPILLGHKLWRESVLGDLDLGVFAMRAIKFLILTGPITAQERWEEASGFSPSTLATVICALICSADAGRVRGFETSSLFLESYADWLERNLDRWTTTDEGTLVPGVQSHYVRIAPANPGDSPPENGVREQLLQIASQAPDAQQEFPAKDIVDGGFLELVRYGIRRADDPLVVDSVKVIDAVLKVDTASGVLYRRYNHDGYGQRESGEPYAGFGLGRGWPLLTGERGHYEIAAGRSARDYIRSIETLATKTHLIPEQSWDTADTADGSMQAGRPTGAATPLAWAHAEYLRLLRSERDGKVFDRIPVVAARYLGPHRKRPFHDIWIFACPIESIAAGNVLRIVAEPQFDLRWTLDDWQSALETPSVQLHLGLSYADIKIGAKARGRCQFTFFWRDAKHYEGRNFTVDIRKKDIAHGTRRGKKERQ